MEIDSRDRDVDAEDTIISADAPAQLLPDLIAPGAVEQDFGEAQTIIVSRAARRREEAPPTSSATPARASTSKPDTPARASYAMRIGTHTLIPLNVPSYIGRKPSTPRITGVLMPRLVMVPSPLREVSSTHVEILQEADNVIVTDLGSTNGTIVTMTGFPPRTLRQGESLVVGAGAVVDIGDGIRIVIVTFPDEEATEGTQ